MLITVDPSLPDPLYVQIVNAIQRAVTDGTASPGERLPPARELAKSLEVNMHTVGHAYKELRDRGVVDMRRGRGVVIATPAPQHDDLGDAIREVLRIARDKGIPLSAVRKALEDGARS